MNARIQQPRSAFPRQQRGAMLVLVVIAMASLLLMGALALDGSHRSEEQRLNSSH